MIDYARKRGSQLTAVRVGFYLERHRESLMVGDSHLAALRDLAPGQARYLDARREKGRLVPG